MIFIGSIILFFYTLFMGILYLGNRSIRIRYPEDRTVRTKFSIIIPFRNEAKNIPDLMDSLLKIDYPLEMFEIIFVDDDSSDASNDIITDQLSTRPVNFKLIKNIRHSGSPKKDAITQAIKKSKHQWILTTDADCVLSDSILRSYDDLIQNKDPYMVVGPLGLTNGSGLCYHFQNFENLAIQSLGVGGFGIRRPFLCNGANLAYRKELFYEVKGFEGNDHISSGDDIFLFEKINKKYPDKVSCLRSDKAIVLTQPLGNWKHIIEQRVRWASKTAGQKNMIASLLGLMVFFTNFYLIIGLYWCIYDQNFLSNYIIFFLFKILIDLIVISPSARFFGKRIELLWFMLNSFIYPLMAFLITIRSLSGKYEWKGRRSIKPLK